MRYLKTYEQIKDFYGSSHRYLIVSEDEKWFLKNNIHNHVKVDLIEDRIRIFPSESIDIDIDMTFSEKDIKDINIEEFNYRFTENDIGIEKGDYEKYGKDLEVSDGIPPTRAEMKEQIMDYFDLVEFEFEHEYGNKTDEELLEDFVDMGGDDGKRDNSYLVKNMKFKIIEFIIGLQKYDTDLI